MVALLLCLVMFGPAAVVIYFAARKPPALVFYIPPWKHQIRTVPGMIPFPPRGKAFTDYSMACLSAPLWEHHERDR